MLFPIFHDRKLQGGWSFCVPASSENVRFFPRPDLEFLGQRLLCRRDGIWNIKHNMQKMLAMRYPVECLSSPFMWLTGSCPASWERPVPCIASPGKRSKFKLRSMVSTECLLLWHHHKVEKPLSWIRTIFPFGEGGRERAKVGEEGR